MVRVFCCVEFLSHARLLLTPEKAAPYHPLHPTFNAYLVILLCVCSTKTSDPRDSATGSRQSLDWQVASRKRQQPPRAPSGLSSDMTGEPALKRSTTPRELSSVLAAKMTQFERKFLAVVVHFVGQSNGFSSVLRGWPWHETDKFARMHMREDVPVYCNQHLVEILSCASQDG